MRKASKITDSELLIMEVLWSDGPMTAPQITARLEGETGWGRHTVMTLLKRMIGKGSVRSEEMSPARLYHPLIPKEAHMTMQTRSLIDRIFAGSPVVMLNCMVESKSLSREDVDEMVALLEKARKEAKEAGE